MRETRLSQMEKYQITGLGVLVSSIVALAATLLTIRVMRHRRRAREQAERAAQVPIQPSIETRTPAQMPQHFSENLIIPGVTATGQQIAQQDETLGRSPDGV